jgi:hypothetical protein
MHPFVATMPTVTISMIYCIWNAYVRTQQRQERTLRDRVTQMLWMAAMQA